MNRNEARALVLALTLAALAPASAQTPATPQPPAGTVAAPAAASASQSPNRAQRDPLGDADARHCLELASNVEIIACAEKYRSHRARK
jgi:hypothetical protein